MNKFLSAVRNFLQDETGATAIEYGLMVGLIGAAIVVIVKQLGISVQDMFAGICNTLKANVPTGTTIAATCARS